MSLRNRSRKMPQVNIDTARLQDAQERVSRGARQAAERMGPTARQARKVATEQMRTARVWGAPRLEQAGDFIEHEVGPRVGAMLHRTADKVEPAKPKRRRGFAAMLLIAGGAIGAAGAVVTRRNAARSTEEHTSPEHLSAVSENSDTERAHSNH
jgi:hypothetical protein